MSEQYKRLFALLETISPSGHEMHVQRVVYDQVADLVDEAKTDVQGNLLLGINTDARRAVMIAGHCDQIGFMVRHIDQQGFLSIDPVGGIDPAVVPGSVLSIAGKNGPVIGVVGKKPTHLESQPEQGQAPKLGQLWVDIGAKDYDQAAELIEIGSFAAFEPRVQQLQGNFIAAPALDNKVGLFAALEALRLCADEQIEFSLWAVSTVQEELGTRGAQTASFGLEPCVGIAVDTTFAYDDPGNDRKTNLSTALGKGPTISRGPNTNIKTRTLLIDAAQAAQIPYQMEPAADLEGNDSKVMQVTGVGMAAASVGIPIRSMHTQAEVCCLDDVLNAARLIAEFVKRLDPDVDFRSFPLNESGRQKKSKRNRQQGTQPAGQPA